MVSLAGLWRKVILYRLQKRLFPQRWEAFSVHLRKYSLRQNPTVLLEGPPRKDVHDWTQCYPSVSSTHCICCIRDALSLQDMYSASTQICALELPWSGTRGPRLYRGPRLGALFRSGQSDRSSGHSATRTVHLCRVGNGEKLTVLVTRLVHKIPACSTKSDDSSRMCLKPRIIYNVTIEKINKTPDTTD